MTTPPSVLYVMAASTLHGGNRVVLEHAAGLAERGYRVTVVSPEPAPAWHPVAVPFRQLPVFEAGALPPADIAIGTFWTTVRPAWRSGAAHVFHLCQGFEGVHREYAELLPEIDAVYRLPIPKLLISRHLLPVLEERYGSRCHLLGQALDTELFSPAPEGEAGASGGRSATELPPAAGSDRPLVVGLVGPFAVRSKGIRETLAGLALARRAGHRLEVCHASADPMSDAERALGMTDHFHHHLPTAEMPAFYRRLDAYLHPSHDEEGFPLPPLEAMACGVATAVSSIRSFEPLPEEAVLRFSPGEPEAIVPVVAALADPERRRRLAAAGLACARTYTPEKVLDRLERAFAAEGAPTVGSASG